MGTVSWVYDHAEPRDSARHYCRKGNVTEEKNLKVILTYHESSHNILTPSSIHWSQPEWVVTVQSKPFKCFILETLLQGQTNPSCITQLVRWKNKLGQSQELYRLLSAPNILASSLQKWCYDMSNFCNALSPMPQAYEHVITIVINQSM